MANDRLYLRCECGEEKMLYKFYPVDGYLGEKDALQDWLNEHALAHATGMCSPSKFSVYWENDGRPEVPREAHKEGA